MKNLIKMSCVIAFIIPLALVAQNSSDEQMHHRPNPEVGKYIKEQIMPVLVKKRQQFDAELSAAEKKEINDCKAALKQLGPPPRREFKRPAENTTGAPQDDKAFAEPPAGDQRFEQHRAIMQRLEAIVAKHSNSLDEIKKQLEPQRTQWMADIKKLQATANPDNNADKKMNEPKPEQGFMHHPGPEMFIDGHHSAVHFLLLPASMEELNQMPQPGPDDMGDAGLGTAEPAPANSAVQLNNLQILPNPASNSLQLGNDALPATNQLKIYDLNGKEVLSAENVQPAQNFDISQLSSGTYLVQIKSGTQVISKKIVVSK